MTQLIYRLVWHKLKTRPHLIIIKSFMSTINSRNGHDIAGQLIPSKESLDNLCFSDLSSFTESQNAEDLLTNTTIKSEDPFDPDDLVGIVSHQPTTSLPKNDRTFVKQEPLESSQAHDRSTPSPCRSELGLRLKNELSSPLQSKEYKKPKILSSSPVRHFSTSSIPLSPQGLPKELPGNSLSQICEIKVKEEKKRSRLANLPNPTIQLATQSAFTGVNNEMDPTSEATKVVKPIILSAEQEYVLQLAKKGVSIFFTGSAGTGKSVLLRSIIKELKHMHGNQAVAVTASTGLAACNIGGITVHSFVGFGLGKGSASDLLRTVRRNRKAKLRWNYTKVLVIDEISMIDGALFDKIDHIARNIRRKNIPFGGLQLIVCGDFYQLPPVSKTEVQKDGSEVKQSATFAFESKSWDESIKSKIILKEVFRQKGDQTFIDILNDMRHGIVSPAAEAELARLSRPLSCPAGIVPTELYSTRFEVDSANNMKLAKLRGSARVFEAKDGGSLPPPIRAMMLSNFLAPQRLFLKLNAQVMCIKNYDETLVNGSLGKVIAFLDRDTYMCSQLNREAPDIHFDEFQSILRKKKVELAVSKKEEEEGAPLDPETKEKITQEIEAASQTLLDSVFNFFDEDDGAQEVKTEHHIKLEDSTDAEVKPETQMTMEEIIAENRRRKSEFIRQVQQNSKGEKYPLVRFLNPDGVTTRDVLVEPEQWDIADDHSGEVFASRIQLPLMLAWALSIHKSQGQTLQKVKVDLTRIFENGQAYVALSRAVSREGLQVINFSKLKVKTHEIVESFYDTLSTSEDLAGTRGKK